jgi:hypothetical protein
MPNVPMINMDRMVGNENFKRCPQVGVLLMLSEAVDFFSRAALKTLAFFALVLLPFGMTNISL